MCPESVAAQPASRSDTISVLFMDPPLGGFRRRKEPLNKPRAGATEARWDAVLGGRAKQYVDIASESDDEMRPCCPVPSGCGQNARLLRRVACQYRHIGCAPLLASIAFWPQRAPRGTYSEVPQLSPTTPRIQC